MTDNLVSLYIVPIVSTACIGVLTGPTVIYALRRCSLFQAQGCTTLEEAEELYNDEDGAATEESIRLYSDFCPRAALWLATIIGAGASVGSRAVDQTLSQIPGAGGTPTLGILSRWAELLLICLQCAYLPNRRCYLEKFRLTIFGAASSLVLGTSVAFCHGLDAFESISRSEIDSKTIISLLYLVQLVSLLAMVCAFASFRRRPDVYHREQIVDRQYTQPLLSRLLYSWNQDVFNAIKDRKLEIGDLPRLDHKTRAKSLQERFHENCGNGTLWLQLIKVFSSELVLQWILALVIAVLSLIPQLVLYNFLSRIESGDADDSTYPALFIWVLGLLASQLLQVEVKTWLRWITTCRLDVPLDSLLQSLVFSKALRQYEIANGSADRKGKAAETVEIVKVEDKKSKGGPQQSVINLMKIDSGRVTNFTFYNKDIPLVLFQITLAGIFLVNLIGWMPVVLGLTAAAIMMTLSTLMIEKYGSLQSKLMKSRDGKSNLLTEALRGMRQIKYSALEKHWENKIIENRNQELDHCRRVAIWQCFFDLTVSLGPMFLASIAISCYVWKNKSIKASVIFTSLGLLDQLADAINDIPQLYVNMAEAWTSVKRLNKYLSRRDQESVSRPDDSITFQEATVAWPTAADGKNIGTSTLQDQGTQHRRDNNSMLENITLTFPNGKLSLVTGSTGSGKSLLLAAILGEVKLISGTINLPTRLPVNGTAQSISDAEWLVPGLISFVSQIPWIESGTLMDNVLFGLPFMTDRYNKVLHACALQKDVKNLVNGDQTQVGPQGISLSGGQRWRIALARALYSRADILVLDDVLSAVDPHVGQKIVNEALTGELARGRTRILATHHSDLVMPHASYLVRLNDGRLELTEELSPIPCTNLDEVHHPTTEIVVEDEPANTINASAYVGPEEKREVGRVQWKVYKAYFQACGGVLSLAYVLTVLGSSRFLMVAKTWSLKQLSQQVSQQEIEEAQRGVSIWLLLYVFVHVLMALSQVWQDYTTFSVGMRASAELFQRMTNRVLRAPMQFTNTTPCGSVVNRFNSDISIIDTKLPKQTFGFLRESLFLAVIITTSLSASISVLFFGCLLCIFYILIAREYIGVARDLKRIESTSRSPIYDQFGSVLSGLSTVRAFGRTQFYMDRMYDLIDNSSKAYWALELINRWMTFRMGLLGSFFVTIVASAVVSHSVDAALAGFCLHFSMRFTKALTALLKAMTTVELGFNACERVLEYAEIEAEPEGGIMAPAAWPSEGRIEVDNLTVRYAENEPPVLKSLTFTVNAGERLGIVGRTGAGKSTLASVLFRILDPSEGSICIDGLDISTLNLTQLRNRLAIIPQDPFLFSGTLRSNLDVEGIHDDYDLRVALGRVYLAADLMADEDEAGPSDAIQGHSRTNIFANLSTRISSGGANLSQGQRQLVCLARALLQRPKIVVLDEATSAVDRRTDSNIQVSLRREFAALGCTLLVIAHRLSTVADFDRVLVLSRGSVVELGSPRELLKAKGAFWKMVQKSAEADELVNMILG
ncbi:P-loop containing nucleoside triphosphate hydrolase protein [Bombardia bombarda]|uniref:P-loop containing nucleoside triphosphate hydrolase protein n=1 Tax=Bombardia bombarda TaxID=252184 RepID=A0AA39WNC6_9PEZI|nr:P-loop containing nucleoside triphosphate hydrolase protein [Bombardia bombarda]